jgi:Transposase DNA-binding/Transposase DDE domain/Transposase Tn5 dimerisation domain
MESHLTDPAHWAHAQFGGAKLGHRRRTKRLVRLATQIAIDSMASLPDQTETWADLKAAYGFFDNDAVTFPAVATPHWERTRDCGPGRWLILNDTTELDFGPKRRIKEIGPVGSGIGQGFLLHNALMTDSVTGAIRGLAGQELFLRKPAPKGESRSQRRKRERESEVWGRVIEAIGLPPSGAQFVHVMDRGADDFEVFCRTQRQQCDWVVRLKTLHRRVQDSQGIERPLDEICREIPPSCCYELALRARPGQTARTARVEVSYTRVTMLVPRQPADSLKSLAPEPIAGWVVQVREIDPPEGVEPVDWVLFTSLAVETVEEALQVVAYYKARWGIEEFHKALKTGCNIERRQLKTAARLAPLVALLSVQAVRLIQLKAVARAEPNRPTEELVPQRYVQMLERCRKLAPGALGRVRDFFRTLAKLGGFLGRKGDGEPGWLTIWRGWEKLYGMVRGADLVTERALE